MSTETTYPDRMKTLLKKSNLPELLTKVNPEHLKPSIKTICENIRAYKCGSIYLHGPSRGKSTNAAAILLNYLNLYRYCYTVDDVGYYISANELCRFNKVMDRYNREDYAIYRTIMEHIKNTKCLILDNIPMNMTQVDELLFNAIYDQRQYANGLTIYTSLCIDTLEAAGTFLYRVARDANHKESFTCLH